MVLAVLCVMTNMLHAQTPDTQPHDERVVYDTLFVHDTLHVRDTINIGEYIRSQTFEQLKSANAKPPRTSLDNNPLWLFCYTGMPKEYPYHGYDVSLNFAVRFCKIK